MASQEVPAPSIDRLLVQAADHPDAVLTTLRAHPSLAGLQDAHGYSLVHAAASYGHSALLTALIREFGVDPNIVDEDDETALFSVEEVRFAQLLIELGTDRERRNADGLTAEEKLDDEDEMPEVAAFLRSLGNGEGSSTVAMGDAQQNGMASHPPPLPEGIKIEVGTMQPEDVGEPPDPEFRRRIEELAARPDFELESGQRELRSLIEDAVSGFAGEGQGAATRLRRE